MEHKLALIGFGGMAGWHHDLIERIDGLTVAGTWDIREERRALAREKGLRVYRNFEDLLADPAADLALVATPNDLHRPLAIAAMEAGKHVVSEKPVTLCSEDLRAMTEASERTGRLFTVHQNRRWDEDFLTIREILAGGRLGEVHRIESRVHGARGIPGDWRQEPEHGGGMVLDWGVHLLDQALQLFPGVKLTSVYASLTHVTNQLVDDGFSAELAFANGVRMLVEVGTSNFLALPRWYVLGRDGSARIAGWGADAEIVRAVGESERDVVPVRTAAGLTKTMAPRRPDSIRSETVPEVKSDIREFWQNVMAAVEGREAPRVRLDEAARVMRLMEAVFASDRAGQAVAFEA
ncbi:MAG: Gfo/Idh/MocA family oxidoreductase [Oscillospiraceae bacterium]|nr:Gfo/Idh/MocA family oxidoreductase [Oscillospiraceae bacterium]